MALVLEEQDSQSKQPERPNRSAGRFLKIRAAEQVEESLSELPGPSDFSVFLMIEKLQCCEKKCE